ncbi:MAG: trypsin-like peptidase domain-containing protein [Firmicutes bacterium]|nr:trypsin-like peptidase domain-containing protein [Bacillota bacterium]MDY3658791.1 trypsin-like peptidase domain-containing protein [Eubacteriales bacterium]
MKFVKSICLLLFFLVSPICFSGCFSQYNGDVKGTPDVNINMTPRLISSQSDSNFEEVVETVTPAVVGISAVYKDQESVGSGVAVADGGYILTNNHVVEGASSITVYYANKTSGRATLVWTDPSMDLAIIKASINMPYLKTASLDNVKTGEEVISIGTPLTLQFKHTVTKGIVSALNRTIEIDNEDGSTSYLQNLLQHDASINPGNSGGPVINSNGKVVGINTLKVSEAEGIGFAIPVEIAMPVVEKVVSDGEYVTPYLGIFGLDSEIAVFYGKTFEKEGVYVVNVDTSGPIGKAGIVKGDIITKVNDQKIRTMLDLRTAIYHHKIGDTIKITFLRDNIEKTASITLTNRP